MKSNYQIPVILFALCVCIWAAPAVAEIPPGGEGWIAFKTNVAGASVYINDVLKGTTDSTGEYDILYKSSFTSYTVKKTSYYDASGSIELMPGAKNTEIPVTLELKPAGSGKGWFTVHCNIDGASVAFNGATKGTIAGGVFTLEVATSGTPYTTYSVSKTGYYTYEGAIPSMPADGQTADLYATLNPVPTPTTAVTTVATPIGGDIGWYTVHCNVDSASVYFDGSYKGIISGRTLSVGVYTTGTPYSSYRVEKSGYVTATGPLPAAPSKGQTKDVYVTLNPVPTATPIIIGGDKGYFVVHCNVEGASVWFDSTYQGVIANGVLTVQVAITGTPYSTYEVSRSGYIPFNGVITDRPAKDQTIDLYATLTPAHTATQTAIPTTAPATTPITYAPLPETVIIGALAVAVGVLGSAGMKRT